MIDVDSAIATLAAGGAVVIPTDTVYGVAASLEVPGAIDELFALKARERDKPIPVLGHDAASFAAVGVLDDRAGKLAARFWPGPLTLVVPRAEGFTVDLGDARDTVALRVPDHALAREILRRTGPLGVTSANRSGEPPAATAAAARAALGPDVPIVDAGVCAGSPSTVVGLTTRSLRILRPGSLTLAELEQAIAE